MKQVLILALATASFAGLGLAAPCGIASLAAYSAASFSCTIGGDTLSNFSVLAPLYGSQIANSSIIVTPSGSTYNPTLTFSTNPMLMVSGGNALETYFSYDISGQPYVGISSTLSGSAEKLDGAVNDIVSFCEGGSFDSNGVCSLPNSSLSTVDGALNTDMANFGAVSMLNVTNDFVIAAGTSGAATGGTFTNSFTAVPEPFTTALTGLGAALVGVLKIRGLRAKQESKSRSNN